MLKQWIQLSLLDEDAGVCRLTAELMIEEIGRRPTSVDMTCATQNPQGSAHHPENREGYAWSAAIALGLITLGKGRNASGLTDMRIEQRLRCALCDSPQAMSLELLFHNCIEGGFCLIT